MPVRAAAPHPQEASAKTAAGVRCTGRAPGIGARRDADGRLDGEPRVGPIDHAIRQPLIQQLAALQEEGDDSLMEARTHPGQIHRREVNTPALAVESDMKQPVRSEGARCKPLVQELALQEERDDPLAEAAAHLLQIKEAGTTTTRVRILLVMPHRRRAAASAGRSHLPP